MKGGADVKKVEVPEGLDTIIIGKDINSLSGTNDSIDVGEENMKTILDLVRNCNTHIITAFDNAKLAYKYKKQLDTFFTRNLKGKPNRTYKRK